MQGDIWRENTVAVIRNSPSLFNGLDHRRAMNLVQPAGNGADAKPVRGFVSRRVHDLAEGEPGITRTTSPPVTPRDVHAVRLAVQIPVAGVIKGHNSNTIALQ